MVDSPGVFTISLDTELAWGCFDTVGVKAHEAAYRNTRSVVHRLCTLFDRYDVSATWAIVTHLLEECKPGREEDRPSPQYEWIDDWFGSLPCSTDVDRELWYAPDIVEAIRACDTPQEIGLHGDTHMILGSSGCSEAAASAEIEAAVKTARKSGIEPESFVYPRNSINHQEILRTYGISVYRTRDSYWYERIDIPDSFRKPFRFLDEALSRQPPVVEPRERQGLLEIPGSQAFRPEHGGWGWTPTNSQTRRAIKGLNQAAKTGKIFHLWFHPFNIALEPKKLFNDLQNIVAHANKLREKGHLEILPFQGIADLYRQGRWT